MVQQDCGEWGIVCMNDGAQDPNLKVEEVVEPGTKAADVPQASAPRKPEPTRSTANHIGGYRLNFKRVSFGLLAIGIVLTSLSLLPLRISGRMRLSGAFALAVGLVAATCGHIGVSIRNV